MQGSPCACNVPDIRARWRRRSLCILNQASRRNGQSEVARINAIQTFFINTSIFNGETFLTRMRQYCVALQLARIEKSKQGKHSPRGYTKTFPFPIFFFFYFLWYSPVLRIRLPSELLTTTDNVASEGKETSRVGFRLFATATTDALAWERSCRS